MFDLSKNDGFSLAQLSAAIDVLPNNYGRLEQMNVFPDKGVRTRQVILEERNGVLSLIPSQPVGAPAQANVSGKRTIRSVNIPHIPLDDVILPQDIQGVRKFGTEDELTGVSDVILERLALMKAKHAITREWLRIGALKGRIIDGDGVTELNNLFTIFGIEETVVDFVLGTANTKVKAKCLEVRRHIEKNLGGEIFGSIRVMVDESFFDKLTYHSEVKDAYARWQNGAALRDDMRKHFSYGGLDFEEYPGVAVTPAGVSKPFFETDTGRAFPMGTGATFATFNAPGNFMSTVNTIGQAYYAKLTARINDTGYDLHTESNPLPLCLRPAVLVKVYSSN